MIRKYLVAGLLSVSPAGIRETPSSARTDCRIGAVG
jgi:hypothetical protein